MNTTIRARNLGKAYRLYDSPFDRLKEALHPLRRKFHHPFQALADVSFDVAPGEPLGIIGKNGSGKSTLLQMICGVLQPTSGSVEVRGRVAALLELGAGFNPEFTGRQNIQLNAAILGLSPEQIAERFDRIVAFADIGQFLDQPVKTYSSGMVVRLAFSVIAHVDADILIVDEALAVGDVFFVQKCMRFIRRFVEHKTLLFVTHDVAALRGLCSTALWLDQGRVRMAGPVKEVSEAYLASMQQERQGADLSRAAGGQEGTFRPEDDLCDMRQQFINQSSLRNDIEVFPFDASRGGFGTDSARIEGVRLLDTESGRPCSHVVGGEVVRLEIVCSAKSRVEAPIVGFFLRDRLGQELFGDNTYISYQAAPVAAAPGEAIVARFTFRMPALKQGEYSLTAAIASGTQAEHIHHHWVHDALILRCLSSHVCQGLMGVPMSDIRLEVTEYLPGDLSVLE